MAREEFQFLIGRLKTINGFDKEDQLRLFQFLIGRLKTSPHTFGLALDFDLFQFLIGRLKTIENFIFAVCSVSFQFLIGRLKTNLAVSLAEQKESFNSL